MISLQDESREAVYRWAVWLLIVTSTATMLGRIASVVASTGETPMLSANDRSRWCTIRALVEDGTYAIDRLVRIKHPETGRRFWKSIDMVRHRGPDGKEHYYSSKPTLLPTLLAGLYWLIFTLTGANLGEHPFAVMRIMIAITNVLPLLVYFLVLWRIVERLTPHPMVTLYAMAVATWGTFLTTFAVTINNHLVAAVSILLATSFTLHIWWGERRWWYFAAAGLFSAFAAANELPALSFLVCVAAAVGWKSPSQTLLYFSPAVALIVAGFFATNYLAHGTFVPAYAHRSDGPVVAEASPEAAETLDREEIPTEVEQALNEAGIELSEQALALIYEPGQRWGIWDRVGHKRFAIVDTGNDLEIRLWDNWYDYRGSYWQTERQGVDQGEPSRLVYALHMLIGHRGIFSLTPVWLLAATGIVMLLARRQPTWGLFAAMVLGLTIVCLAFYIQRPQIDRNYGGVCCGFRWMFWFIPLWNLCLVPATARLLRSRRGAALLLLLLLASVFSATYASDDPWSQPWIFDLGTYLEWWSY